MGQRRGFAASDLARINKMYNCDVSTFPSPGTGTSPGITPPRPNNNFNQLLGGFISGVGSVLSGMG